MIEWINEDTPLELLGWNFFCNTNCSCNTNCGGGYGTQAKPCEPPSGDDK
jgi:hypothetical protein